MFFGFSGEIVNTLEKASEIAKLIEQSGIFALKTIKSVSGSSKAHIVGVSLCIENRAFYFPVDHSSLTARQIGRGGFKNVFSPLLSSGRIKKLGYDLKQERNIYKTLLGINLNGLYFDVMLASYCLDPAKPHAIDDIADEYLNFKVNGNCFGREAKKTALADFSAQDGAEYANSVSAAVFAAYEIFSPAVKEKKLSPLFFNIEMPLIEILSEMEISGIKVDMSFLSRFSKKINSELKEIETSIYKMAGGEFNINSHKQLAHIMFEKFNFPVVKKTKTGYSTDEKVLGELSSYEFPAALLKYRELQKLKSAYIDPLYSCCASCGGRVHTAFNQAVTATGRLSSTEPNLQNIPVKSVYGREFRKVFVSGNGRIFLSADYSQIDLRVLAHVSRDPKLMEAFKNGVDIHGATAREIFNIPEGEFVSESLRNAAKSINFGIIYGMSPFGLSKQLNIPFEKAKEYINGYFEKYSGVKLWTKQIVEQALRDGYVCTITGRIRYIPDIYSERVQVKNAAERIALNTPIQGSSADIIKTAMINIYNEIKIRGYKSQLLLQVHDDLLFEVPVNETDSMISIIRDKMENSVTLSVPMAVDIKAGKNWGEMKDI
jgi:DNA polymerase-1